MGAPGHKQSPPINFRPCCSLNPCCAACAVPRQIDEVDALLGKRNSLKEHEALRCAARCLGSALPADLHQQQGTGWGEGAVAA